jgi:hypothetical protein
VLHYPLVVVPLLFFGLIRGIAVISESEKVGAPKNLVRKLGGIVCTLTFVFAAVYSPLSPLNSQVQGGYFAGNHDLAGFTSFTSHDAFLWEVIGLIPRDASVLTENDLPQVSGRPGFFIASPAPPSPLPPPPSSGQYDYILGDSTIEYFASFQDILPFVNSALADQSFGILAMGQGTILLQRGYRGPPVIFELLSDSWGPNRLALFSGRNAGDALVHVPGDGNSFSFWYGPGIVLPPGEYRANFFLQVYDTVPGNTSIITIQATSEGGSHVWASRLLTLGAFAAPKQWQNFTLSFSVSVFTQGFELRGMFVTNSTTIALKNVTLIQIRG